MNLQDLLRQPDYATLDDTASAILASTPVSTPKRQRVTLATLGDVWGLERATVFRAHLKGMVAFGEPGGALADVILDLLGGGGFDPAHRDVEQAVAALIDAKACTQEEAIAVTHDAAFPTGSPEPVTAEQVAEARARNVAQDEAQAEHTSIADGYDRAFRQIEAWQRGERAKPTWEELIDLFAGKVA